MTDVRQLASHSLIGLIAPQDRIIVTGAGGWFGRTAIALLLDAFGPSVLGRTVLAGQSARVIQVSGQPVAVRVPSARELAGLGAEHVINCGFPTRDKASALGLADYSAACEQSTQLWLTLAASAGKSAVTFSSGAAVDADHGSGDAGTEVYAAMKRDEERETARLSAAGHPVTVARVWSVSGSLVQRPAAYAFSDLVGQHVRGQRAAVSAQVAVWRRYCLIDDVIAVAWASAAARSLPLFDSGGDLIELRQLAAMINGDPLHASSSSPAGYYPRNDSFERACAAMAYRPASLSEQLAQVTSAAARWPRQLHS